MKMWIDTEFNEFRGDLISMAIMAADGKEWYEVLPCENPGPWVAENVIPILGKEPIPKKLFQWELHKFLMKYNSVHLIADWPEDIAHFCEALITAPGQRINTPSLTMEIWRDLDAVSEIPHNALSDARAIRDKYLSMSATLY